MNESCQNCVPSVTGGQNSEGNYVIKVRYPLNTFSEETRKEIEVLIEEARQEGREEMRLKNAGLYRQLFGEMSDSRVFSAKEVWEILDWYAPLFTEETKKQLSNYFKGKV